MNTRWCMPINPSLIKKHFPENSLGFLEKLDLSKIRFNAVNGGSNSITLVGRFSERMTSIISMILHAIS